MTSRISAEPVVVVADDVPRAIQTESAKSAIAIFGFEPPEEGDENDYFDRMESLAGKLDCVLFIKSAGGIELES